MKKIIFADMRKSFFTLLLLLAITGLFQVDAMAIDHGKRVNLLMKEYSGRSDFDYMNVGRIGISLMKTAMRQNMDPDTKVLLDLMKDIKQISIASYDDCDPTVKSQFSSRLSKILTKDYLLMEAKESDEKVQIYAIPSDNGDEITDLIINAPGSGALICVKGTIKVEDVAKAIDSMPE